MVKTSCILEGRVLPVQLAHPAVNVRVSVPDSANVTLEVPHVHGVEADLRS
jgi:hypothetical protein